MSIVVKHESVSEQRLRLKIEACNEILKATSKALQALDHDNRKACLVMVINRLNLRLSKREKRAVIPPNFNDAPNRSFIDADLPNDFIGRRNRRGKQLFES